MKFLLTKIYGKQTAESIRNILLLFPLTCLALG